MGRGQLVEIRPVPVVCLGLQLCLAGNPNHGQYAPHSDPGFKIVAELRAARKACGGYIENWNFGEGNWGKESGVVRDSTGTLVARFSYNMRGWLPGGGRELWVRRGGTRKAKRSGNGRFFSYQPEVPG